MQRKASLGSAGDCREKSLHLQLVEGLLKRLDTITGIYALAGIFRRALGHPCMTSRVRPCGSGSSTVSARPWVHDGGT